MFAAGMASAGIPPAGRDPSPTPALKPAWVWVWWVGLRGGFGDWRTLNFVAFSL